MRTVTDSELVVLMTPVVLAAEWWASGGTGPEKLDALKKAVRDYRRTRNELEMKAREEVQGG